MSKHIKYGKTPQLKDVIRNLTHAARFVGLDGDGNAIYNNDKELPIVTFNGTTKLHGSHADIVYNDSKGIWYQSRNQVKTEGHFDFVATMNNQLDVVKSLIEQIKHVYSIDTSKCTIMICGEWAGTGIHRRSPVSIEKLSKCFYMFAVKINPCCNGKQFDSYYLKDLDQIEIQTEFVDSIFNYETFSINIDFSQPHIAQNEIYKLTQAVETECPVSKAKGVTEGVGEGIVWVGWYKGQKYIFKSKGEKHSSSNVKEAKQVNLAAVQASSDFANAHATLNRVKQAIHELGLDDSVSKRNTGDVIKWVVNDIKEEEAYAIGECIKAHIPEKNIMSALGNRARVVFFKYLDNV